MSIVTEFTPDEIRQITGLALTDKEAQALADWYAALARGVAAFPEADVRELEPPLRSTPGPPWT
jgi:hypothetical protein